MKFLIFNVAVAAALVFMFTADRGEVQRVAGQVHDAVGEVKDYARKALDDGTVAIGKTVTKASPKPSVAPPPPPQTRAEAPPAPVEPPKTAPQGRSEPPPRPTPPRTAVAKAASAPEAIPPAPSSLDPAVAQRRREVLDGIATAEPPAGPLPALKEGSRLMSASDRRRELQSLAEEMELLYARTAGR